MVVTAAGALLLAALLCWVMAGRLQRRSGLPVRRVHYDDASLGQRPERPLVAHRYRLTGRPDYLLEERGSLIPVEVKPTRRAPAPYPSDLLQLAAYCLLVEETTGQRPPYGLLRYADATWRVPFDESRRAHLLATLAAMEEAATAREVARSHEQPARCRACSQRAACDQCLA